MEAFVINLGRNYQFNWSLGNLAPILLKIAKLVSEEKACELNTTSAIYKQGDYENISRLLIENQL